MRPSLITRSRLPVDDGVGQGLELVAAHVAVEAVARTARVVERHLAGGLERACLGHPDERAVERAAGKGRTNARVFARRQDQRQRRRSLTQVGARDLAGLDRLARAVEDVVRDLEGDPEGEAELAEAPVAAASEQARGLEQLARLERAALEVVVDARLGVVRLRPLK